MNTKTLFRLIGIILFSVVLTACQQMKDVNKPFKHNTPLIKENIKKDGRAEIQKTLELGPKPCLLYTSPSPRDATLSRMPSSA